MNLSRNQTTVVAAIIIILIVGLIAFLMPPLFVGSAVYPSP